MLQPRRSRAIGAERWQAGFSLLEAIIVVAITLVLVALTSKAMFSAWSNYTISTTARQIGSVAQVARSKATGRNNRYRVTVNTSDGTYRMEYCSTLDTSTTPASCSAWTLDPQSADYTLGSGVSFSTSGLSVAAPGESSVTQAADMTFNSRGVLIDSSSNPLDSACFYMQRSGTRPAAVCTSMVGKTTVYQLQNSTWQSR